VHFTGASSPAVYFRKEDLHMIEMFKDWYDFRHEYAKNWKEKNGGDDELDDLF